MKKIIKLEILILLILYIILDIHLLYDFQKIKDEKYMNFDIYYNRLISDDINSYERDLLLNLSLNDCQFALKFIEHAKVVSFLKSERFIEKLPQQLKKAFQSCQMEEEIIFFNQIAKDKKIVLTKNLYEQIQIKNIFDYYYLIEPESLLAEMKRMNYQSEDALLIMEKLEIDINWNKNHNDRIIHEDFYKKMNDGS